MDVRNEFELRYRALLMEAMYKGVHRDDRTGVGCNSVFAKKIEFDTQGGEYWPLLTGKRMFSNIWRTEAAWFLKGETDNKRFKKAGVTIWDAWMKDGSIGKGYGYQLRNWAGKVDQLQSVIESIHDTPDSRRHLVSLWNAAELDETTLAPCHYSMQFFTRTMENELDILVNMRSVDLFLGLPYDFMLYFEVLKEVAKRTKYKPGKIIFMLGDTHVYDNHHDAVKTYIMQPVQEVQETGSMPKTIIIKAPVAV